MEEPLPEDIPAAVKQPLPAVDLATEKVNKDSGEAIPITKENKKV